MTAIQNMLNQKYDVAIIGSGAGGGTLAYALTKIGHKVLLLERGFHLPQEAENSSDEAVFGNKYNSTEEMEICGLRYEAPIHAFVGGETKLYGAALYRFREEDFGELDFPDGVSPSWPVTYDELEPYYSQAEKIYRVHGNAEHDPGEPRHSEPYPYPPIAHEAETLSLVKGLERQGLNVHSIPRAIDLSEDGNCTFCTTCDAYACPTNGKLDTEIACINPALKTGNLSLVTKAHCDKLLTDDSGKIVIAAEVRHDNQLYSINAKFFVVACGVLHSPALLLRSANLAHPNGLANASDQVGRNLAGHNAGLFYLPGFKKQADIHQKTFAVNDYYLGDKKSGFPLGMMQAAGKMPLWQYTEKWLMPIARFVAERSISCFIMSEVCPTPENRVTLDADNKIKVDYSLNNKKVFRALRMRFLKAFWKAGYLATICSRHPIGGLPWHPVGTVRFGSNPETSVLDQNCKTHNLDNLYVVDSGVLPSAGAVNTSLTVMALALRAADHLSKKLKLD